MSQESCHIYLVFLCSILQLGQRDKPDTRMQEGPRRRSSTSSNIDVVLFWPFSLTVCFSRGGFASVLGIYHGTQG